MLEIRDLGDEYITHLAVDCHGIKYMTAQQPIKIT